MQGLLHENIPLINYNFTSEILSAGSEIKVSCRLLHVLDCSLLYVYDRALLTMVL